MSKKEEFRSFVSQKPNLAQYIESGQMTWQKFYELYDIYGEDNSVWDRYDKTSENKNSFKFNDLIKNVDMDSIKEHIGTAQKALDFVQELTSKTPSNNVKSPISPRPLNKFFED